MIEKCKHCKALFWANENLRNNCCHGGKVKLPKLTKYNKKLKKLLFDRKFRELIRYYNSEYSFVTFVTKDLDHNNEKGIYNLKIQGQVFHITPTTIESKENEKRCCGQMYLYDDLSLLNERLKKNTVFIESHINELNQIMKNNPYTIKYKHLHELTKDTEIPEYYLIFTKKSNTNQNVYNEPRTAECAAIILSN